MSILEVSPVRAFKDNYIWLLKNHARQEVIIVDPGDAQPVLIELSQLKYSVVAILITHKHTDHIGGVPDLLKYKNVPVFGNAVENIPATLTHFVTDGHTIAFSGWPNFLVMEVPGHTVGHVAYLVENKLFCGDTLFGAGCGRVFEGTPAQMLHSLNKIKALPDNTLIFCAHEYTLQNLKFAITLEPDNEKLIERKKTTESLYTQHIPSIPSNIALEKATNPFFRCDSPSIRAKVEAYKQSPVVNEVDVFTQVRAWRSQY